MAPPKRYKKHQSVIDRLPKTWTGSGLSMNMAGLNWSKNHLLMIPPACSWRITSVSSSLIAPFLEFSLLVSSILSIREATQKNGIFWEFFPNVGPPPPPLLEKFPKNTVFFWLASLRGDFFENFRVFFGCF